MYTVRFKDTNQLLETVNGKITFEKNKVGLFTFSLYPNTNGFEKLEPYITDIIVYDDNNKVFDGQVISVNDGMNSNGIFSYDVYCVDRWDYLNRTKTGRWDIHPGTYTPKETYSEDKDPYTIKENMNVQKYLKLILDNHNSKVSENRKVYLGNVTVNENVTCTADREVTLKEIQLLAENKDAYIDIRETDDGKLYLDFLQDIAIAGSKIEKAINLNSIEREGTLETVITRIIPVGKDNLTIKSVNGNKEYIEDSSLKAKYGVIEEVVKWDDVTVAANLLAKAKEYLKTVNDNKYAITITSKDLSYISERFNRFKLHQECEIWVDTLNIWQKHKIIKIEIDLENQWNSKLTFCNSSKTLTRKSVENKKSLDNTIKNLQKNSYDNTAFKVETNTKIETISTNEYREKIYRIMGVI